MRLDDILAYKVLGVGPELLKKFLSPLFECAHIVDEGVKPDVRYVPPIERQLNAPSEPALGPRNTEIADRLSQHGNDFILETLRADEVRMRLDVSEQLVLIFVHAKKVIVFLDQLGFG